MIFQTRFNILECARLYEHSNQEGAVYEISHGASTSYIGGSWNDKVSSIVVSPGCTLTLYEHSSFTGREGQFTGTSNQLVSFWNDQVSGYKCDCHMGPTPELPLDQCFYESPGWCHASGDPHYLTYDGARYDFMGTCRYLFSGVTAGNDTAHLPWFDVQVQHRRAWNTQVAMTEHVWFSFDGMEDGVTYTIYISVGDPPQGSGYPSYLITEVTRNYNGTTTTATLNEMRNDDFTLINHGNFVQVTNWFSVEVEFTARSWAVDVHTPPCYEGHLEGLCGNWNGDRSDDFTGADGEIHTNVVDFGQSWQTAWAGENCEGGPDSFPECTDQTVIDDCSLMTNGEGVFAECLGTHIPYETFEENCVFDYCLDAGLRCPILSQYAQTCFRALQGDVNNTANICSWAEDTGCAPECGQNSHYTGCADVCRDTKTCGNRFDSISHCPDSPRFISMCVCDDGYVLENGECIAESSCGCNTDDGGSVANGYVYDGCDRLGSRTILDFLSDFAHVILLNSTFFPLNDKAL